jgi:hypothetical protein
MSAFDYLFILTACVDSHPLYPGFKGCYAIALNSGTLLPNYAALTAVEVSELSLDFVRFLQIHVFTIVFILAMISASRSC